MSDWDRLGVLEVDVEDYELERREVAVSSEFSRVTTTVAMHGRGETGRGEDVTYDAQDHEAFPADLPLAGRSTLAALSARLDRHDLFARPASSDAYRDYRRWAFESAALDLALRQAGMSLGAAVGRSHRAVRFVASTRSVDGWIDVARGLEFKVDPTSEWSRDYMDSLAATGRVRVVDLKGYYRGTPVDQAADPRLYRDVVEAFPDAIVEDAAFTDETRGILRAAQERLSFDGPIHSVADVEALEVAPRFLNIKPSRFGTIERLLACIAYCEDREISMYGGGQFELGVGRDQIQKLASVYYSDAYNDVAPREYNEGGPRPGLPQSPLPAPDGPGF